MKPQLSIIIPVINEAEQIAKRLQALQPLRDRCQLLMVDGGSSDGSGMLAVSLVDHVLTSPRGRARQMNVGAERTQADILLFLHIDTHLPDHAFNLIQQAIADGYCWGRFDVSM